jgi:hypothetical protein
MYLFCINMTKNDDDSNNLYYYENKESNIKSIQQLLSGKFNN